MSAAYIIPGLRRKPTPFYIEKVVIEVFKKDYHTLTQDTRVQDVAIPRMIAMYFMRVYTTMSQQAVADFFYRKAAATTYNAEKVVGNMIATRDKKYHSFIIKIDNIINKNYFDGQQTI